MRSRVNVPFPENCTTLYISLDGNIWDGQQLVTYLKWSELESVTKCSILRGVANVRHVTTWVWENGGGFGQSQNITSSQ